LWDCYYAFREHPRLIKLCCTSDALEALVATHSEDDLSLYVLCWRKTPPSCSSRTSTARPPWTSPSATPNPAVFPFVTEAETPYRKCNYPALIKLCGPTPDWNTRAKLAKDKKDKEDVAEADRLEAKFFDWDENGVR